MSKIVFCYIKMDIIELFNNRDINTNQPLIYRTNTTFLVNYTDNSMLIDSSKSILLRTPSTDFVKVIGRLGVDIDPSNIYSLHVLGDTCISGSIITNGGIVSNGPIVSNNINKLTTDISLLFEYSTELNANFISLYENVDDFSLNYYTFKNSTISNINEIKIDISSGFKYNNDLSATLLDLSINHYTLKNSFIDLSSRHYSLKTEFNDLSASKASLQSEVNILTTNLISVSNELYNIFSNFIYSIKTGFWGTLEFIGNEEFRINDLQFRVGWLIEWPTVRLFRSNYNSINTNYVISSNDRLYSLDSSLIIQVKSINNNSFSTTSESETLFVTQSNISIYSELLNNDSLKQITLNLANIDTINNGLISIYYNPLYKGFFGTLLLTNNNAVNMIYNYAYNTINGISFESSPDLLTSNTNYSITISNEVRVKDNNTPLLLTLTPDVGYDISITALLAKSINLNIEPLRVFTEGYVGYQLNLLPFNSNLEDGLIGLSFEVYKTGFFGILALANKTNGSRFDYSYNYISIKDSSINKITQTLNGQQLSTYSIINYSYYSGIQTLSGQELSYNSITSANRLAYANSPLNLSLLIYDGYDISVNALSNTIVGISNNILNATRLFSTSNNINYNYNIIPLSSNLVNGLIGLSFEMYRTGFFGTFALGNKTGAARFDYSYNYISISGSNVTSRFSNFFTLITQISPPSPNKNYFGIYATKFAKTTNNKTIKVAFGNPLYNYIYFWNGTTISNELILLPMPSTYNNIGVTVSIDNVGQYIVSGGRVDRLSLTFGGRIWSTTPPYNSTIINYPGFPPQSESNFTMSAHISGNGQRVFVGSPLFNNIYAFSHTDLSLTQIGGAISAGGLYNQNSFSMNGFASDNDGTYLITSAYLDNYARGYVILYRFNNSTWVQTHGFSGTANNDFFGSSIDMNCGSGEWACAGAPNATTPYVKIYKRNTITNDWTEFQTLNGTNGSGFGISVSFNESGSNLYVTTTNTETFYYTRLDNSEQFTLTSTIPSQEPTSNEYAQCVSTNSSGNQVILVKSSTTVASAYYLDKHNITISSANRLAYATSPLNLSLVMANGYDISVNALPNSIVGISNNILTSPRLFDTSNNINYNYNIIPLTSYLFGGNIELNFEMYRTGFFGTFALGNKTGTARFDYSYNYISISGSNVNSIIQTLSGVALINNDISSANRLRYADASLNLSLVIYNGYDISVNALPSTIIGISNNILSATRTFNTSNNINYNYNIIPLSSYLFGGTIGLSFELYRTGFFGTFALGNKTSGARFDYSYNYISISGSNVNSIIQTLSGVALINNDITSANRLAYADAPLNLSLIIADGYDISVNALPNSIVGISNNILSATRTFNTSNNINYNYNIIPLTSYLFGGTIGLSFEMYRTGFFGTFALGNKTAGARFDYSYNYISISGSNVNSIIQTLSGVALINNSITSANRLAYADAPLNLSLVIYNGYDISVNALPNAIVGISNNILTSPRLFNTSDNINYNYNIIPLSSYLFNGTIGLSFEMYRTGFFGTFALGNKTAGARFDYSYNYISISGSNVNSIIQTLSGVALINNSITSANRLPYVTSPLNLSLVIYNGYDISVNALSNSIVGISNNILTSASRTFDISNINYNYNIIPLTSYLVNGNIGLSFEMYRTGFFGTFVLGNKTSAASFDYSYSYISISSSNVNSIIQTLSGQSLINNDITSANRLAYATSPLNLTLVIAAGYDISVNALPSAIVGISNNILSATRTFNTSDNINYNYNIIPLTSFLLGGTIGLSFEMYRTGFFGTFALGNKTAGARFDYSYNYISISGSNVNSIIQTLSGQELSNNSITSANRLAYATSSLNLSLVIYNGYDISVNALQTSIIGISNNILTSPRRTFDIFNINHNYNIIPLSSYLFGGTIGLSFELYRTGFFGTFALGNNTANTIIEYSYNYISISGSIYTNASNASTFYLIIQKSPPSNSVNTFGQNSTKFAKTTNTNNNGTFKAAIGAQTVNGVYYWTGTTTNNQLILLQSPSTAFNLGQVVAIDNAGQYIVSGGYVSNGQAYGGRIWSTTSPYNSTIINYPFLGSSGSFIMSVHISGNGQRVFVGSPLFTKIYAFTHNNLSLTQIGGAITCDVTDDTNTFTTKGFASDNNANYLITSAWNYYYGTGLIVMYHFNATTWIQSGSVFFGTNYDSYFGTSIDMNCGSGEWACAGAPNATTPYVKIYKRNTTTNAWTEFQRLTGSNGSGFGTSVSFNESGSNLYVTTTNTETFYYTRPNNNELFTLTLTIPVQQPTSNVLGQWVSTNNLGTQVILVKSSPSAASAYYFENTGGKLNGGNLIIDTISSANRLAYATSSLNLSLLIADGYDISVNALPSSIVGISNNILTSPRLFNTSNIINYNYNIIPLTSYLVNGNIGLSFELYRTGFFGTFTLGNKTAGSRFDYSYNYISISGSLIDAFGIYRFTLITQKNPTLVTLEVGNFFGENAIKFAKTTNTNNNGTFKAAIGAKRANGVFYWTGTSISNEFILLSSPVAALRIGTTIGIDNAGQYIVGGGYVQKINLSDVNNSYGGRIWSTTPPYNSSVIKYPFPSAVTGNFDISIHISGNGQRVFVGSWLFRNFYAFSHNNLILTQIENAITCDVTDTGNSFTTSGFASDNNANYLITSAWNNNSATGFIVMYHFNATTWIQSGSVFHGTAINNRFGFSIDMNSGSGIVCCAGAPNATPPYVKIYQRVITTWSEFQRLDGTSGSGFGTSVSLNESGSSLYVTTTSAEIFYYTRPNNNEQFTLTSTIPSQEPTSNARGQWVSTNSSGTQVILAKSSSVDPWPATAYFFDYLSYAFNISGEALTSHEISSTNRVVTSNNPLNLSLLIYDGYDISVNALPNSIVGISNNILTSPRLFNTSNNINYNYNIIPLTSFLLGGTIGLSFEMYKTGFFGTFALGNKTAGARFDYSYNYISISGSNVNSIIQTLSGVALINNNITSANRLPYATSPLNLSLVIYNGYDISVNALPNSIIGISNNILTSPSRTFDISNINHNYNIIPLSSYLFGGTIGLSFEMYRTGFFGAIVLTNNGGSTIDYSYNYISINSSIIYSTLIPITNSLSNTRTISGEVRLRDATSQIAMNIRTASSAADISYSINGGTINTFVITTISSYKHSNFNILPNINNLVNGTLTFNLIQPPSTNTGWYGNLYIVNQIIGGGGRYFIFKASDATGTINVLPTQVDAGQTYTIEVQPGNRLPTMSSVITFEITVFQQNSAGYDTAKISGATYSGYLYSGPASITANSAGTNITITIPVDDDT